MYPLSSRNASARKRIKMFGRNVRIPPTPRQRTINDQEITQSEAPLNEAGQNTERQQFQSLFKVSFQKIPDCECQEKTNAIIPKNAGIPGSDESGSYPPDLSYVIFLLY